MVLLLNGFSSLEGLLWLVWSIAIAFLSHISTIFLVPRIVANKMCDFCLKYAGSFNTFSFRPSIAFRDRKIILPCPDFLYSVMLLRLSSKKVVVIELPPCEYQNFAVYNLNAQAIFTRHTHENKSMKFILVGPSVIYDDNTIMSAVSARMHSRTDCSVHEVVRCAVEYGPVLHRLLMKDRDLVSKYAAIQEQLVATEVQLPETYAGNQANAFKQPVAVLLLALLAVGLSTWFYSDSLSLDTGYLVSHLTLTSVCTTVAAVMVGIASAVVVVVQINRRNAFICGSSINIVRVWPWVFSFMLPSEQQNNVYANLITFLHGAFALPLDDVVYAATFEVRIGFERVATCCIVAM